MEPELLIMMGYSRRLMQHVGYAFLRYGDER